MIRDPNKRELFAMFFWHAEYAAQGAGAIEFYKALSDAQRSLVEDCLRRLNLASGRWPT